VPVLDVLATVAFSIGYVWVGAALWRGATGQTERDADPAAAPTPNTAVPAARG
jgi:hypothetical protein